MTDNPGGAYSNGALPSSVLTTVQGSQQLRSDVAVSWFDMVNAAAASGVSLTISGPAGAYRSLATQQDMHDNPSAYNIPPGATLAPVGSSTHGWGTCLDLSTAAANNWAIANALEFGFERDRYPAYDYEFNHWHYTRNTTPTGTPGSVLQGGFTLFHLVNNGSAGSSNTYAGWQGTIGVKYIRHHSNQANAAVTAARLPVISVASNSEMQAVVNGFGIAWTSVPTGGAEFYAG